MSFSFKWEDELFTHLAMEVETLSQTFLLFLGSAIKL